MERSNMEAILPLYCRARSQGQVDMRDPIFINIFLSLLNRFFYRPYTFSWASCFQHDFRAHKSPLRGKKRLGWRANGFQWEASCPVSAWAVLSWTARPSRCQAVDNCLPAAPSASLGRSPGVCLAALGWPPGQACGENRAGQGGSAASLQTWKLISYHSPELAFDSIFFL